MYSTAKTFLKMIAFSEEIQIRRDPTRGNLYWDVFENGNYIVGIRYNEKVFNVFNDDIRDLKRYIWLPTMLQLQIIHWKMAREKGQYTDEDYQSFVSDSTLIMSTLLKSSEEKKIFPLLCQEEAYLAMMYLTLYDKGWNGKAWVKVKVKKKRKPRKGKKK